MEHISNFNIFGTHKLYKTTSVVMPKLSYQKHTGNVLEGASVLTCLMQIDNLQQKL